MISKFLYENYLSFLQMDYVKFLMWHEVEMEVDGANYEE
jgi:hypothetical protein